MTPDLWNDYFGAANRISEYFEPEYARYAGAILNDLVNGWLRPKHLEDRWIRYPHLRPKNPINNRDKIKIARVNRINDSIAVVLARLEKLTVGIPENALGKVKKKYEERPWAKERYQSHRFEFDLNSQEFHERKIEIQSVLEELKSELIVVGKFFYGDDFGFFGSKA